MDQDRDKNWRDMCQTAATEQDPDKLTALVAEIISALDDRNRKAAPPIQKKKDSPGISFPSLPAIGRARTSIMRKRFIPLASTTVQREPLLDLDAASTVEVTSV